MSSQLSKDSCEACRLDAPVLSDKEISDLSTQIPSWIVYEEEGVKRLVCSFAFSSYKDSVNFTNKVAELAETEDSFDVQKTCFPKIFDVNHANKCFFNVSQKTYVKQICWVKCFSRLRAHVPCPTKLADVKNMFLCKKVPEREKIL